MRPLLMTLLAMSLGGQVIAGPESVPPQRGATEEARRAERLEAWLAAVERHEPGTLDASVIEIASWPAADLKAVLTDLDQLARFLARAYTRFSRSGQLSTVTYGLRSLSMAAVQELLGLTDDEAFRGDVSRMALRAALLHTDIATLYHDLDRPVPPASSTRQPLALMVLDGRQLGLVGRGPHWELARALFDLLPSDPAHDESRRRWYIAIAAYMQKHSLLADYLPHLTRGRQLFPADADILLYSGCMHETMASPLIQAAVAEALPPPGIKLDVTGAPTHLQQARTFLGRALEIDPDLVEAHLRLGRVLGQLGRRRDAVHELKQALTASTDPPVQYYAALFLGEEQEALGDVKAARTSYERAAGLFPGAQSPRLALSRLARDARGRTATADLMRVLTVPEDDDDFREDPWWTYYRAAGHAADLLLADWRRSVEQAEGP